jgi:hypothetical protein
MIFEGTWVSKQLLTLQTFERFLSRMHSKMTFEMMRMSRRTSWHCKHLRSFSPVCLLARTLTAWSLDGWICKASPPLPRPGVYAQIWSVWSPGNAGNTGIIGASTTQSKTGHPNVLSDDGFLDVYCSRYWVVLKQDSSLNNSLVQMTQNFRIKLLTPR